MSSNCLIIFIKNIPLSLGKCFKIFFFRLSREREKFLAEKNANRLKVAKTFDYQIQTRNPELPKSYTDVEVHDRPIFSKQTIKNYFFNKLFVPDSLSVIGIGTRISNCRILQICLRRSN